MTTTIQFTIDPAFQALIPSLSDDELAQLKDNLLTEGCRDPLVVWEEEGVLLDGHHRYKICQAHDLDFEVHTLSLPSSEAAINWIINNQLGRRNLTPEQQSYLRGKRYNLEKKAEGRPEKLTDNQQVSGATHERLGKEYGVAPSTIQADGQFAAALDTLEDQVSPGIRESVLKGKERGEPRVTKQQVTNAAKLVKEHQVKPLPCMKRDGWTNRQVLDGLEILTAFPESEHSDLNTLLELSSRLDQSSRPAATGLKILKNLRRHTPEQRQHLFALVQSQDPSERSLAYTLAARQEPEPGPQSRIADDLIESLERVRKRLTKWREDYPDEPWSTEIEEIAHGSAAMQDQLSAIVQRAEAAHQQSIAHHIEAFQSK
jgi:hypothetical protein